MAARRKPRVDPAQIDLEEKIAETPALPPAAKASDLIAEFFTLKDHSETQSKAFAEYLKPTNARMEEIRQTLHAMAIEGGVNGFPTDSGTAYLSTILNHTIDPESTYTNAEGRVSQGRDALLDWALDHWEDYGSEGLQIGISKAVVDKYMQDRANDNEYRGKPPPGLKLSELIRLNIRRS